MNQDITERFERLEKEFNELKELLERKPGIKPKTICRFWDDDTPRKTIARYHSEHDCGGHNAGTTDSDGDFVPYGAYDHAEPIEQREVVGKLVRTVNGDVQIYMNGKELVWCGRGSSYYDIVNHVIGDRQEMELYA
jgi:hypothetical protein